MSGKTWIYSDPHFYQPSVDAVERVARALWLSAGFREDLWDAPNGNWKTHMEECRPTWLRHARAALSAIPPAGEPIDWWKPDPEDPYWMLEVREGFDDAGSWLKNQHSYLTTRDPAKALRFPGQCEADRVRRGMGGNQDGKFEPTAHKWSPPATEASGEVVQADREAAWLFMRNITSRYGDAFYDKDALDRGGYDDNRYIQAFRGHRLAHSGVGNVVASEREQIDFDSAAALSAERELRNKLDWLCHTDEVWPLVEAYRAALSTTEPVELQTDREKGA